MKNSTINISGGWMPDLPDEEIIRRGGLVKAKNILPIRKAYYAINTELVYNDTAFNAFIINGVAVQDSAGLYHNYAGTLTKLYRFNDSILTDVTRTSGDYVGVRWSFAEYGEWLVATNFGNAVQVIKGHSEANFEDLGGSPPNAKFALVNSGHLILAHLIVDGVVYPKKIIYSATENIESWTASLTTGAGSQDFPDMIGIITGMGAIGSNFVVAAENSLTVGYYIGGQYTYGFRRNVVEGIGCYYPNSFISIGEIVFFWGKESIYSFDGSVLEEIGKYIKHSIFNSTMLRYGNSIKVAQDKINGLVFWTYPTSGSSGEATRLLIYNYIDKLFTVAHVSSTSIFMGATGGILLDTLTTTLIDTSTELIDSEHFNSKTLQPMIAGTDKKIYTSGGSSVYEAEIETAELSDHPNCMRINEAQLFVEGVGSRGLCTVKYRDSKTEESTSSKGAIIKKDCSVDLRTTAKRIALNYKINNYEKIDMSINIKHTNRGIR